VNTRIGRPPTWVTVVVGLLFCGGTSCSRVSGQVQLPGQGAAPGSAAMSALPASVPPDTVVAVLSGPAHWQVPIAIAVWPDTVKFGEPVTVVVDFPAGSAPVTADSLTCDVPWLIWADAFDKSPPDKLLSRLKRWFGRAGVLRIPAGLPPAAGPRIVRAARIFRMGPYRLQWGDREDPVAARTAVSQVASRLTNNNEPVGVRWPRSLGWRWPRLVGLLAALMSLVAGAVWLMRRRHRRHGAPAHTPIPPPAYLLTAQMIWALYRQELPARGQGRLFLDQLTAAMRGYLRNRFRIRAEEMTAKELLAALRARGYKSAECGEFAQLLQEADDLRYAPERVVPAVCDGFLARAIRLMAAVQVVARFAPVPADLAVAGQKCWSNLWRWLENSDPSNPVEVQEKARHV